MNHKAPPPSSLEQHTARNPVPAPTLPSEHHGTDSVLGTRGPPPPSTLPHPTSSIPTVHNEADTCSISFRNLGAHALGQAAPPTTVPPVRSLPLVVNPGTQKLLDAISSPPGGGLDLQNDNYDPNGGCADGSTATPASPWAFAIGAERERRADAGIDTDNRENSRAGSPSNTPAVAQHGRVTG